MNTKRCMGTGSVAAGGAGNESYIELWNPSTSGIVARVSRIVINSAETAGVVKVKYHTSKQGSTAKTSGNKLLGGAAPLVEIYGNSAASVSGTQIGGLVVTANTRHEFDFLSPIDINPGLSLVLENTTANLAITAVQIEWDEVD